MKLRNIDFGKAIGASGIQGFFSGEEYFYHKMFKAYMPGFSCDGMTFVAKTMTLFKRQGNAELKEDGVSMKSILPDCIWVNPIAGIALNAVGLTNIGSFALLEKNIWQQRTEPFMLSFMAVDKTKEARIKELECFVKLLLPYLPKFKTRIALQMNFSCPNTEHRQTELINEIIPFLDIASKLDIPLVPKLNLMASCETVLNISKHPACDAICLTNTIPFGELPDKISWKKYFKSENKNDSPLAKYDGGGGLSSKPLFPLLCSWLNEATSYGFEKPFIAGGGIMHPDNVKTLAGIPNVKAISPGSVSFLRPWRLQEIIKNAYLYL